MEQETRGRFLRRRKADRQRHCIVLLQAGDEVRRPAGGQAVSAEIRGSGRNETRIETIHPNGTPVVGDTETGPARIPSVFIAWAKRQAEKGDPVAQGNILGKKGEIACHAPGRK